MPNLFPAGGAVSGSSISGTAPVSFGSSWQFDFAAGEFALTPTGAVTPAADVAAWVEWCQKALQTPRYRYLAYGRGHGHEFDDLIARHLSRQANEAEIKRIVVECLMADLRTAAVREFAFAWTGDECWFSCQVVSVRADTATIAGRVVIP